MRALASSHGFKAWACMVVLTLIGWFLVEETDAAHIAATVTLLVAGIKVTLVIAHFMELRWRPAPWRGVLTAWTGGVIAILLGGYWIAASAS